MKNKYFPEEEISKDDLYFICYMIERVAQDIHQPCKYVVDTIGKDNLYHLLSCAQVLHCENPLKVVDDWIRDYNLATGDYDIDGYPLDIGKKDQEQILKTGTTDYVKGVLDFYREESYED